jgi:hypothetical protein
MCLIKGAFFGEKNFDLINMHGATIKNLKKTKGRISRESNGIIYYFVFCGRNVELVVSTRSFNHTHYRPHIGSFSRALHCLLERIYPTDDGVVGDDPCRNA